MWASVGRLVPGYGANATGGAALGAWTQHPSGPPPARVPQHAAPRVDRGPNEGRVRSISSMPELPSSSEPAGRSGGHAALPALQRAVHDRVGRSPQRSEEHTSELQSRLHLVCRLLLEKKKTTPQKP